MRADQVRARALQLRGRNRFLAQASQLVADPVEGLGHLARAAADVDGEVAGIETFHGEAGDAVG